MEGSGAGVVLVLLAGSGATPVAAATATRADTPPASAWGVQVAWLLDVSHRLPAAAEEVAAHIDPAVLAQVGVATFNQAMASVSGTSGLILLRQAEAPRGSGRFLAASDAGTWLFSLSVQAAGLILGLAIVPYAPASPQWTQTHRYWLAGLALSLLVLTGAPTRARGQ